MVCIYSRKANEPETKTKKQHIYQEENTMTVNNEVITKALTEAQSVDEMVAAFADQGIDITAEELKQVMKDVLAEESGEELSEGDLEGVSGGSAYNWAMNTARNIIVSAVKTVGQAFVNFVKTTFGF
jgi:predicted ribosomally synthesized peptide with nif11-like leader